MTDSTVFFANQDENMVDASMKARHTLRYFWREIYWDRRRIISGVDIGMVKAAFQEGVIVEHMWVSDIYFDGYVVNGFLANQPNELTNINRGDPVEIKLHETLTDWLLYSCGVVYGGFSIHEMRLNMSESERAGHDEAWGLPFGDPAAPELPEDVGQDHPMAANMVEPMMNFLKEDPDALTNSDEMDYTMLHDEAVAGNVPMIKVLLKCGADKNAKTKRGDTPLDLATKLGWTEAMKLL